MQKGQAAILIVVAILIVAATAGGAYYLGKPTFQTPQPIPSPSVTPNETANPDSIGVNWKTYTNTRFGYSFEYPPDKYILQGGSVVNSDADLIDDVSLEYCPFPEATISCGMGAESLRIAIYNDNDRMLSFDSWWRNPEIIPPILLPLCVLKEPRTTEERQNFLSYKALIFQFTIDQITSDKLCPNQDLGGFRGEKKYIFVERNKKIFVIDYEVSTDRSATGAYGDKAESSIARRTSFENIISTFKFLE